MPTLEDFEKLIDETTDVSNQFATAGGGSLAFKGNGARLATFLSSSHKKADTAMLKSFHQTLVDTYGREAAMAGFKKAKLTHRVVSGEPLSVKEATLALREARAVASPLVREANTIYRVKHAAQEGDARNWDPRPNLSRVEGSGLRLVTQDQGEFRLHHWNAKNNPDEKGKVTVELDELVEKEVAAIKAARLEATGRGEVVAVMSERLMYLQAKLNLTERMVAEASLSKNLKEGGPSVNVFLGPDMFFAPSEGPGVAGSCGKTTGGACTEEEMKAITEGLRRISERHPEVTLMPGTIVWSKPVDPVPVIDGLPRPTDMAYNTGPVFSSGSLTHMTYKMTDGGDANTTAVGINGPTGSAATAPSLENRFGARLQVFPKDAQTMDKLTKDGKAKVEPILDTMARQAAPLSGDRDWEVPLRGVDAGPRSPYNTIFTVGDKVMALEICRDHSNGQAEKEYRLVATAKDPVSVLAKARGGADLHVLLAAASTISPNSTVCRTGGVMTYNDIGKGRVHSYFVKERVKEHDIKVDRTKKLEVTYQQYDAHKKGQSSGGPAVGLSSTDMKGGEPVRLAPVVAIGSGTGGGLPVLERPPGPELGLGLGLPIVDRAPSVREAMRGGAAPGTESRVGLGQTGTEATAVSTGPLTVRSEAGLDKPKATVGTGTPTVSVGTGI